MRRRDGETLGQVMMGGLVLLGLPVALALVVWLFRGDEHATFLGFSPSDPRCDAASIIADDPRQARLGVAASQAIEALKHECNLP